MSTMKKFAAQKLSKIQMNNIRGGAEVSDLCYDGMLLYTCVTTYTNGKQSINRDCSSDATHSVHRTLRVYEMQGTSDIVSNVTCS